MGFRNVEVTKKNVPEWLPCIEKPIPDLRNSWQPVRRSFASENTPMGLTLSVPQPYLREAAPIRLAFRPLPQMDHEISGLARTRAVCDEPVRIGNLLDGRDENGPNSERSCAFYRIFLVKR